MAFNNFPYTDFHETNTDWLLKTVKESADSAREAEEAAEAAQALAEQAGQAAIGAVRYDVSQELTNTQKTQARENIEAMSSDVGAVRYDTVQALSSTQVSRARSNIGAASASDVDTLNNSVVKFTAQSLSTQNKNQARQNIDAASVNDVTGVLKYTAQTLTNSQKAQARENIGAISSEDIPTVTGTVHYDQAQSLTNSQKAQARNNISAAAISDIPNVSDVLRYSAQTLTVSQKRQARQNIGVAGADDMPLIVTVSPNELGTAYECDYTATEIFEAWEMGRNIVLQFWPMNSDTAYNAMLEIEPEHYINGVVFLPTAASQSNNTSWYNIYISAGTPDTISVTDWTGRIAPATSISDNGKVLGVSSGKPAWMQITPITENVTGSTPSINAVDNTIYKCGTLTSLTISSFPASGKFWVWFTSGTTATAISGISNFITEPNTKYRIFVEDGNADYTAWPVS